MFTGICADRRLFRAGLALDVLYGMVNLLTFLFISRVLHLPPAGQLAGAVSYFDFVAVGLAFFLVVQAACTQTRQPGPGRTDAPARSKRPPPCRCRRTWSRWEWGSSRSCWGCCGPAVYLGIAILLLGLSVDRAEWPGLVIILLLGTAAAMGLGIALAALSVAFSQGAAAGRVVVVGLSFLSGVYFPTAVLPGPLPVLAGALPTTMAVQGLRAALVGAPWGGIAVLLALCHGAAVAGVDLAVPLRPEPRPPPRDADPWLTVPARCGRQ